MIQTPTLLLLRILLLLLQSPVVHAQSQTPSFAPSELSTFEVTFSFQQEVLRSPSSGTNALNATEAASFESVIEDLTDLYIPGEYIGRITAVCQIYFQQTLSRQSEVFRIRTSDLSDWLGLDHPEFHHRRRLEDADATILQLRYSITYRGNVANIDYANYYLLYMVDNANGAVRNRLNANGVEVDEVMAANYILPVPSASPSSLSVAPSFRRQ